MFLQEVHRESGNQCAGEDVGREHGEDNGFGERNEEVASYAAEKEHGHEDDADAERGDESGNGDLGGAIENGFALCVALFEVAFDVFDGDSGVVDEDADSESEAAKSHDVDGLVQETEDDDGAENRKWNGDGDDEGAAPASEEYKDHDAGEAGGDDGFTDDAADGAAHEDGLVGQGTNF